MKNIAEYIPKNCSLLDVGCGHSYFFEYVKDKNVYYTGLDTSVKMLKTAKDKHPEATVLFGDIFDLSGYAPRDIVVCIDVLIHLPEIEKPIKNLWKTTKKLLIFTLKLSKDKPQIRINKTNRTVKGVVKFPKDKFLIIRWDTINDIENILSKLDNVESIQHFPYDVRTEIFVLKKAME